MKIGVDIDEILADFLHPLIAYHNQTHKTSFKRSDFSSYNLWETLGGTKEEMIQETYDFYKTDYFKNMKPISGSQEIVNSLKKENELFVITSRHKEVIQETQEWINKYFPETFSGIYFADYRYSQEILRTKRQICDELGVEILIDDALKFALECVSQKRKILLFNHPWNQCPTLPEGIIRIHSWNEAYDLLEG